MAVITTGNLGRLIQDGVKNVFGQEYAKYPLQYPRLFSEESSDKAFEVDAQFEGFGIAHKVAEGEAITYDSQQQGFTPKYIMSKFGKGFIVTEEAMEDNRYDLFNKKTSALAFSMVQTKEIEGANVYNRGFNTAYTMLDGDGEPLFSTGHINGPTDPTTFSNTLAVPAALSEAAIEQLLIQIAQATDPRGLRIALKETELVVPPTLKYEAERITASVLQNDTALNAVNAIRSTGMLPSGYSVNNYLTSNTAWFIRTNCPNGVKYMNRRAVRFEQDNDFGTSNMRFKATERYTFGWTDPRGAYGTEGA